MKHYSGAAAYQQQEQGYRDKALKMYPWVCGRCAREFVHSNLRELTVHHIDHNHSNNPSDGSNWQAVGIITITMSTINSTNLYSMVALPNKSEPLPTIRLPILKPC
ncbi:hypothetical protein ALON55S_06896 [Alishewanella longhuensis]